jgi:hypothetical protein
MRVYPSSSRRVIPSAVYSQAIAHCQAVFPFRDAVACTAAMLWSVLVWAASRAASLSHAVHRLYPDTQDQTFWNRLRAHLPKQAPALERRLNELLRLPDLMPRLAGRSLDVAVDYHAIPYYGVPKKTPANCVGGRPNAAPPASTLMPRCASSWRVGGTRWR